MVATYDANDPSEDRFDYMLNLDLVPRRVRNSNDNNCSSDRCAVDVVGYTLSLFGVYDGHGGGDCAQFAQDHLLRTCAAHIAVALDCEVDNFDLGDEALEDARDARHSSVNKALCTAFVNVDERWMSDIDPDVVQSSCFKGGPWNSGSCAVVAALLVPEIMDEDGESRRISEELTSKLYTAHLGDCRAVLFSDDHIDSTDSNLFLPVVREKIGPYAHLNCCEQLTEDHAASNKSEQTLVENRCGDSSRAIITGASGVARVAGSLAVTRALGDAYLKRPDMSFGSYKEHCPFITCVPEVSCKVIGVPFSNAVPSQLLCMGTDGIFEKIESNQSIINEIQSSTNQDRSLMNNNVVLPDQNLSNIVIDHVIENVCSIRDLTKRSFTALKPGRARRSKHDDMTFMTIDLSAFLQSFRLE